LRPLASARIRVAVVGMVVAQVVMVALMIGAPLHVDHHGHGLGLLASSRPDQGAHGAGRGSPWLSA
jgi:hypothetical protein